MFKFTFGVAVGVMILSIIIRAETPQDNPEARVYCEMRKIFEDTNGEFGWPDYRSDIECSK
jgi:hypothetical protein